MEQFKYYAPTKILFGKNTEAEVGELCKTQGASKVLYTSEAAVPKNPVCLIVSAAHCRKQDCTM